MASTVNNLAPREGSETKAVAGQRATARLRHPCDPRLPFHKRQDIAESCLSFVSW